MNREEALANLSADMLVCDLFASLPAARDVFARHGYRGCGGLAGPRKGLAEFSRNHGVPLDQLLREVRDAAEAS